MQKENYLTEGIYEYCMLIETKREVLNYWKLEQLLNAFCIFQRSSSSGAMIINLINKLN